MTDLEKEFDSLKEFLLDEISLRARHGHYSAEEAEGLRSLVAARMTAATPEPAWDSSYEACEIEGYPGWERLQRAAAEERCPEHGEHPDRCGWSPSMGYHCY